MNTCVVGLGWGDEGKGKIVDLLCQSHDVCVRYNGGANAGHTVVKQFPGELEARVYKSHLLPIGAFNGLSCFLTAGMVIDPVQLVKEIDEALLKKLDLLISNKAHVVLPLHFKIDQERGSVIGTTKRGIGPCYCAKANRTSIRMGDFMDIDVEDVRQFYGDQYARARQRLELFVCDAEDCLRGYVAAGKNILFESANGIQLDIDHGTYPYVTSSAVGPAAIPQSCALPNLRLDRIVGVTKCYMTRVGNGPFPTEIGDTNVAGRIRELGNEYGTTTGRPRRIGWLDLRVLQESIVLTGATEIALMHADTAQEIIRDTGLKYVSLDGEEREANYAEEIAEVIERDLGTPVTMISTGPETSQIIERQSA